MHELKFWAWDEKNKRWLHGYAENRMGCDIKGEIIVCGGWMMEVWKDNDAYNATIIEQFIGLTDKDGKEICEGDLLRMEGWKPEVMQVAFTEGAFCLADASGEFVADIHYVQHAGRKQATIIGNIHENPELLRRETKE